MKTIMLLFALCIAMQGQTLKKYDLLFGSRWEPDAAAYFNSLTTPLSLEQKNKINLLFVQLKDSLGTADLTTKFHQVLLQDNETQESALKNLIQRLYDATAVNSPAWGDTGFSGATSKYINLNINPLAISASLTNFSMGVYHKGVATGGVSQALMGSNKTPTDSATILGWLNGGTTYAGAIGGFPTTQYAPTVSGNAYATGFAVISANGDRNAAFYKNGVFVSPAVLQSHNFYYGNLFALAVNTNETAGGFATAMTIKITFVGKGLTASEVSKINNIFEYYLDSRGHGVQ